jgi:hypothetical protein
MQLLHVGFIFFQKNKSEKKEKYWIHNVFQARAEEKAEKTKILDS